MKSNASIGVTGIITFGHEAQQVFQALSNEQQDEAFRAVALAIADRLNTSLTGLVVHVDESAPHAHFQLPAYDYSGFPISSLLKRADCRELQTLTANTMAHYAPSIERGRPKHERIHAGAKPHEVINRSVAQLHETLPEEISEKVEYIAALEEKISKNERLLGKSQQQLKLNGDLHQKYSKRIELYRKRAEAARREKLLEEKRLKDLHLQTSRQEEVIALNALKAQREAEDLSKRLEDELLSNGQKALLSLKRERDYWRTAFELLKGVVLSLVPEMLYVSVRRNFYEAWKQQALDRKRKASLGSLSEPVNRFKM